MPPDATSANETENNRAIFLRYMGNPPGYEFAARIDELT
jgi:hypothetical protein